MSIYFSISGRDYEHFVFVKKGMNRKEARSLKKEINNMGYKVDLCGDIRLGKHRTEYRENPILGLIGMTTLTTGYDSHLNLGLPDEYRVHTETLRKVMSSFKPASY